MLIAMIGWGALTGIVMTVFIAGLESMLSWFDDGFTGMLGTMIGGGFSAPTMAFLMTATSLFALIALLCEWLGERIPENILDRIKKYAPDRPLEHFKDAISSIYRSIVFGVGFMLGGSLVAFIFSLYALDENSERFRLLAFILFAMIILLFAAQYIIREFEASRDNRGMWWLAVSALIAIAVTTIPVVHQDLQIQERTEEARPGKP